MTRTGAIVSCDQNIFSKSLIIMFSMVTKSNVNIVFYRAVSMACLTSNSYGYPIPGRGLLFGKLYLLEGPSIKLSPQFISLHPQIKVVLRYNQRSYCGTYDRWLKQASITGQSIESNINGVVRKEKWDIYANLTNRIQRSMKKKEKKDLKNQISKRIRLKYCLLDIKVLLYSKAHRSCSCLHRT